MEMGSGSGSGSGCLKPERKDIEKNRRNNMKFLYSHLFSLIPPNLISKGGDQVSDRVDTTIQYIRTLKTSLEMSNNKKEKLMSSSGRKRACQTNIPCNCKSLHIQIHQITPHVDAVLVKGLQNYSSFCHVLQLLDQYCTEVALANFSTSGHSTFHVRHKKIEAQEMSERIKILVEGSSTSSIKDLGDASSSSCSNQVLESNSSTIWDFDFDFQSNVWGLELEVLPKSMMT